MSHLELSQKFAITSVSTIRILHVPSFLVGVHQPVGNHGTCGAGCMPSFLVGVHQPVGNHGTCGAGCMPSFLVGVHQPVGNHGTCGAGCMSSFLVGVHQPVGNHGTCGAGCMSSFLVGVMQPAPQVPWFPTGSRGKRLCTATTYHGPHRFHGSPRSPGYN